MKRRISVIGSSNTDLVIRTSKFPKPGETLIGGAFHTFSGGKGANQAVAAARLGAEVFFIGKVGKDSFGEQALRGLETEGINTDHLQVDEKAASGVASILVDDKGENSIVVAPGANALVMPEDIDRAKDVLTGSELVLLQLEIPLPTVLYSIEKLKSWNKKVVLNPAPAAVMDPSVYKGLYLLTPNESEVETLLGFSVEELSSAEKAASVFLDMGVENVIITMGSRGAYFKNSKESFMVPAVSVEVRDTTGAGDVFNGALVVAKSEGMPWKEAIAFANKASSIAVSRMGAQEAAPKREELG